MNRVYPSQSSCVAPEAETNASAKHLHYCIILHTLRSPLAAAVEIYSSAETRNSLGDSVRIDEEPSQKSAIVSRH